MDCGEIISKWLLCKSIPQSTVTLANSEKCHKVMLTYVVTVRVLGDSSVFIISSVFIVLFPDCLKISEIVYIKELYLFRQISLSWLLLASWFTCHLSNFFAICFIVLQQEGNVNSEWQPWKFNEMVQGFRLQQKEWSLAALNVHVKLLAIF